MLSDGCCHRSRSAAPPAKSNQAEDRKNSHTLSQILAHLDPARLPGLADPAPWRPRDTRTAGLIQAGFARILHAVGLPALIKAIPPILPALSSFATATLHPDTAQAA